MAQFPRRWDEPLPNGKTLADEIREKLMSPTSAVAANGQNVRYSVPNQNGSLPQPIDAPTGGQPLPQPVNAPTGGTALSSPIDAIRAKLAGLNKGPLEANAGDPDANSPDYMGTRPEPYPGVLPEDEMSRTRPWKVGGSMETDPLKRDAARIRAMIENPTAEVNPNGSVNTPHPMGKKKAALLGILMGMAKAAEGRENPSLAAVLAGGATGGIIGGVKPRAIQEWRRRGEVEHAQGELGEQQKIATGQARLEGEQAETRQRTLAPELAARELERKTRYDEARLKIQQDVAEGRISTAEATRKLREAELEQRKEEGQLNRESREKVAGMRTSATTAGAGTKREAKINESASLYKKADAVDANAKALDEHIAKLEAGQKDVPEFIDLGTPDSPKVVQNPARDSFKTQLKELRDQKSALQKEARGLRENGDKARSEGEAIPETPQGKKLDPETEKKIRAAALARNPPLDPEIAVQRAIARL